MRYPWTSLPVRPFVSRLHMSCEARARVVCERRGRHGAGYATLHNFSQLFTTFTDKHGFKHKRRPVHPPRRAPHGGNPPVGTSQGVQGAQAAERCTGACTGGQQRGRRQEAPRQPKGERRCAPDRLLAPTQQLTAPRPARKHSRQRRRRRRRRRRGGGGRRAGASAKLKVVAIRRARGRQGP